MEICSTLWKFHITFLEKIKSIGWSLNLHLTTLCWSWGNHWRPEPIDVLVIGGQDGLHLGLEGVRLHFGVYIHHCALVVS